MKTSQNTPNKTSKARIFWAFAGVVALAILCWVLYNLTQPAATPYESAQVSASKQASASGEALVAEQAGDADQADQAGQPEGETNMDPPLDSQKKADSASSAQAQPQKEPKGPQQHAAGSRETSPKKPTSDTETVGDVLDDPSIDWKNPEERSQAVARMKAAEERELAEATSVALAMGAPLREELADGRTRVLVGLDRQGELLYYEDRGFNAAISTAADKVHAAPYSINGSGVKVGVWENSSPRNTHIEFNNGGTPRVNLVDLTSFGRHATHVTGIIAATGNDSNARGSAYGTTVDAYTTSNDRSEMTAAAATGPGQHATKIYVSNHSYGYTYGWRGTEWKGDGTDQNAVDELYGRYSWWSREFDAIHYNSPYYLAFWAAGNENTEGPTDGTNVYIPGIEVPVGEEDAGDPARDNWVIYNSSIHPPKDGEYRSGFETVADHTTAKNLVVVGAVTDAVSGGVRNTSVSGKASFSSTGPCDDGRIKPDLVGNGVSVYSTFETSDNVYGNLGGTSMSAPNVCGTAALLVDLYRDRFAGGAMRSSTLKGLLIHTATDMGNPGPDYLYGWGLVDAEKAAEQIEFQADNPLLDVIVEDELTPSTPTKTYDFLWDGVSEIRATIAWTDPAGPEDSTHDERTPDLVNDLNLKLIAPDGTTEYFPFVMPFVGTWTVASMDEHATTGVNHTDNVEQVLVSAPGQVGNWQVEVSYTGTLTNNVQEFGLHISGSTNDGPLISPSATEIVAVTSVGVDAASQSFTVQNAGSGTINYTITDDVAWLACSPTSGSSTGEADTINLTFNTAALATGSHTGTITITDPGALNSPVTISVTVIVAATLPYSENFDAVVGSDIPADWSQVFISGGVPWKIQTGGRTGGSNPSTAHSGTKNATLYSESATPNVVRLITPLINVNSYDNLVLSFWHTQRVWTPDQDELKVYYSIDNGDNWVEIAHYTNSISSWTQRSLNLPSGSETMRIAFEGIAKYGYGACVDTVSITGDFVGLVIVTESGGSTDVVEGGATDTYSVVLGSAPTHEVTITIAGDSQVSATPNSLTFTTSNWATPQVVTVSAVDDAVIEPPHTGTITHTSSSADSKYNGVSIANVVVNITDNDNNPPIVEAGDPQTVYLLGGAPWSPSAITTLAWYDAADATTITAPGGTVSQWNDKSGNGRNINQSTTAAQPGYASNTVSFDGTDDYLWNDAPFMYANGQLDVFVVAGVAPTNDDRLLSEGSTTNNQPLYCIAQTINSTAGIMSVYVRDNDGGVMISQPALSASGAFDDTRQLYQWRDTGSQVSGRVNGDAETSSPYTRAGSMTLDRFSMGTVLRSDTAAHIDADVNEIIICNNLSDADRQKMEGYLAHKWGLADNLPGNHPYKNVAPGSATAVAALDGTVNDPDGHPVTQQWTKQAGPAADVTFDDATAIDTNANFTEIGTYTLRLTADDGFGQAYDDVFVTVNALVNEYTVAYSGNENTGGTVPVDPNSPYQIDDTVTVLGNTGSLVRDGYTFNNWNTAANGSGTAYAPDDTFTIANDVTLYAQWAPITYTVSYDGNGNTGGTAPADQIKSHDIGLTLAGAGDLVRDGYSFAGWNTSSDGLGVSYAAGDTYVVNAGVTLYAQWIPDTYTVSYDGNGNTGGTAPGDQTKTHGEDLILAANSGSLVKEGFAFNGWNTASDGSGTDYAEGAAYALNEAITLYAKWISTEPGVTIKFDFGTPTSNVQTGYARVTTNGGSNDGTALVGDNISFSMPAGQTLHYRDRGQTASFTDLTNLDLLRDIVYVDGLGAADVITFTLTGLTANAEYEVFGYAVDMFSPTTNDNKTVTWTTNGGSVNHTTDSGNEDLASAQFQMATMTANSNGEATITAQTTGGIILWNAFDIVALAAPDTTPPTLSSTNPADEATDVPVSQNLVATFDENIAAGSGVLTIKNLTDATESTIDITDGTQISITDATLTINPTSDLLNGKNYAVQIAATAIEDISGNAFAGIGDDTTWNFSTVAMAYTVTYDGNGSDGGTVPVDSSSPYTEDAEVTVLGAGTMIRSGYNFGAWNTSGDGSGTTYTAGQTFIISADTTLYALWTATFDVWAGGVAPDPVSDTNGDGVSDGLAWVLGATDPSEDASAFMPSSDAESDPDSLIFSFRRADEAHADPGTSINVIYGDDMDTAGWNTAVHDGSNVMITVTDNFYGPGVDRVVVKIKWDLFTGDRGFVRLRVNISE